VATCHLTDHPKQGTPILGQHSCTGRCSAVAERTTRAVCLQIFKLQPQDITSHIRCGSSLRAGMASSSCALLGLACFVLLAAAAGATQYKVGGDNGWAVPDATAESFNTWAEKTSFQIGDSLCGSLTHSLTRIRVWAFTCCARVLSSGRSHSLSAPSSS
jgi:hypothetical protein